VPDETNRPENAHEDSPERLTARLDRLERDVRYENRWWRGGLIAALVLVAISIFVSAFHRPRPPRWSPPEFAGRFEGPPNLPFYGYGYGPPPPWAFLHRGHGCGPHERDWQGGPPEHREPPPEEPKS
jgi:hypothetical protein